VAKSKGVKTPKKNTPRTKSAKESARVVEAELIEPSSPERSTDYAEQVQSQKDAWEARGWQERGPEQIAEDVSEESDIASELRSSIAPEEELADSQVPALLDDASFEPTAASAVKSSNALALTDPVALYMAEVRKYPLLTREQEQELAMRYRETGDKRAAEMLVTSNLRFVVKVAAEYSKFGARLIDLVQEGNVGLMHAVREFNPYKGVRLITYAVWWIRGYIQDYLMRQYSMVRIGTTQSQRKLFYRFQKEKELLESMGQEPSVQLLSTRLGVSESDVETMSQRLQGRDVSLQTAVDDNGKTTLLDFESSDDIPIDEQMGHAEMLSLLHEGIEDLKDSLNDRERELLEDRLLSDEPLTLQEIGEKYGVTREAVRQMENRLMAKIRKILEERLEAKKR